MRPAHLALAAFSAWVAVTASSERADACGGTFCDSGPNAMPVDQTGENILFVLDGTTVEAHVQIQYQGSAERFAWIVPMQDVPTVDVGSQMLFTALLQSTVPRYGFTQQTDACGGKGGSGGASFKDGGLAMGGGGSGGTAGGPSVVYEKTVGAFEVVVLKGGTAQEVSDWLVVNNYQSIPSAPTILQDYVANNFVFVALKLTAGAGVDEIHPLVFKYPGNRPCVPLELTAVAATENMGVRTFFLGNDRVVPTNYKHIELNPVRIDWQQLGSNYTQAVSLGADSPIANGQAFVTEYAGTSSVVQSFSVYSPSWKGAAFVALPPEQVIQELQNQGLVYCYDSFGSGQFTCQYNHPLILPLLNEYLPVPTGVEQDDFYGCLSCNQAKIDLTKWNAAEFAADLTLRIEEPGKHAADLLTKWPYLTRMFTTISPAEMKLDPDFHAHPGLQPVTRNQIATRRTTCSGRTAMILPDQREVALVQGQWPAWDSLMPWVERIEEYPEGGGDPIVLVDNTKQIDDQLAKWNAAHSWSPGNMGGSGGKPGGAEASGGGCALGGHDDGAGLVLLIGAFGLLLSRRRSRA